MKKSVLIISFTFPPAPGIGGRRWVKFARILKQHGNCVKVIAAQNQEEEVSEWLNDLEQLKQDVTYIQSSYPKYLGIQPKSFFQKFSYRVSLLYAKVLCKGNYYDKSNYWQQQLLETSRRIILENNIKNVICTIGPFRTAFFLLALKKEFPELNFILDYRDPWTNNKTSFGFTGLSRKRYNYEVNLEEKTIKGFDKITGVSEEMAVHLSKFLDTNELKRKFSTLPNGYDLEDFKDLFPQTTDENTSGSLKIVFAGTFYIKSVHVFKKLVEVVLGLETRYPEKKGHLNFIFAGSLPSEMSVYFQQYPHFLTYVGKKNLKDSYKMMVDADFCSLFLTDDLNYSFSTKFYEYLALKKKIISFSKVKGNNARYIEDNNLGLAVDFGSMEEVIERLFVLSKKELLGEAYQSEIQESFEIQKLTKRLEALLLS